MKIDEILFDTSERVSLSDVSIVKLDASSYFFFLIVYKSFNCFFTSETFNKGLDPSLESLTNKLLMSVLRKKTNFFFLIS